MESIVGLQFAIPYKRQSAYGTKNPDGDIIYAFPFEGADFADHVPNFQDNAALLGKGHEFATRQDLLSWDLRFRRQFRATPKILGWAAAFHTGSVATSALGGSPAAYSHVMEYQDPMGAGYYGSGRQQPVFTLVERVTGGDAVGLVRRFPSCQIMALEITGTNNEFLRGSIDCIGSGMKEAVSPPSSFTFPDTTDDAFGGEGEPLRMGSLLFEYGAAGSEADRSCELKSFRWRSEYQYAEVDGYCPGSGYLSSGDPTSGQIRNKLEFLRRAVTLEVVFRALNSSTVIAQMEAGTLLGAQITAEGPTISGANKEELIIDIPKMKLKAVPIGADGDMIIFTMAATVFYDSSTDNPYELTIVNKIPSYLVSS